MLYNNINRTHHASDFYAQPGGTFLLMGYFTYQYPKQILTIEQQVQSYITHKWEEQYKGANGHE